MEAGFIWLVHILESSACLSKWVEKESAGVQAAARKVSGDRRNGDIRSSALIKKDRLHLSPAVARSRLVVSICSLTTVFSKTVPTGCIGVVK